MVTPEPAIMELTSMGAAIPKCVNVDAVQVAPLLSGHSAVLEIHHIGCPLL
jgi:hypothetical protein